jgi:MFS transporter, ACS family, hexuronate transporter
LRFGWRASFVIIGLVGLIWLPFWWKIYRDRKPLQADPHPRPSWRALLRQRNVWAVVLPRILSDPVRYFCLFWVPDYLQRSRHLDLDKIAAYGWIPFLFADIGSLAEGAFSDWLVRRGVEPPRARVRVLTAVGFIAPVAAFTGMAQSITAALAVICLLLFLTQVWSANITTLASELLPPSEVGTAVSTMGTAGSLGGVLFSQIIGIMIPRFGYSSVFEAAACLFPVAVLILVSLIRLNDLSRRGRIEVPL